MTSYYSKLERLSMDELHRETERRARLEKNHTVRLIASLAEVSRRQVHLREGYSSLFSYCVEHLGLSAPQATSRTHVARVCRRYPRILDAMIDGRLNLTVAGKLAPHVTEENCESLIADCAGFTVEQVREYLVQFDPRDTVSSGIRRAPGTGRVVEVEVVTAAAAGPVPPTSPSTMGSSSSQEPEQSRSPGSAGPSDPNSSSPTGTSSSSSSSSSTAAAASGTKRGQVEPAQPEVFNFRFSGSKGLKQKLERFAEVLGICDFPGQLAVLVESAVDTALERKDPREKQERRRRREEKKAARSGGSSDPECIDREGTDQERADPECSDPECSDRECSDRECSDRECSDRETADHEAPGPRELPEHKPRSNEVANVSRGRQARRRSRHIPVSIRERVLERARYRCEFVGPGGTRCSERARLDIDHIQPYALHGSHEEGNLRALCRNHNQWAARRSFGEQFITDKIEARTGRL